MSTKSYTELLKKWGYALSGCTGCSRRKNAIKKWVTHATKRKKMAAVLFGGGLDSTYSAIQMQKAGYNVHLYHTVWSCDDVNTQWETEAAVRIAQHLDLPLHIMCEIKVKKEDFPHIMWMPTMAGLLICHQTLRFDILATGLSPMISDRDLNWSLVLSDMAHRCMPNLEIVHPRDGILRSNIKLPETLQSMIYTYADRKGDEE